MKACFHLDNPTHCDFLQGSLARALIPRPLQNLSGLARPMLARPHQHHLPGLSTLSPILPSPPPLVPLPPPEFPVALPGGLEKVLAK